MDIIFPNLKDIITCITEKIAADQIYHLLHMFYSKTLYNRAKIDELIQLALNCIDPALLALQGDTIGPDR